MGGLRHRHPGRGGRRRHHDRRHAAELASRRPSTAAALEAKRAGRRGPVPRRRGLLGRRGARQRRPPARALHDGRGVRLQVLPGRLGRPRVPAPGHGRARRGARARSPPSARCCSCTPRTPASWPRRRPRPARLRRTSSLAAARRPRTRRSPSCSTAPPGAPAPGCTCCTCRSAAALPAIAAAAGARGPVTVETCPHYLTLSAEEVPDGRTEFKCCPPIRDAANRDALWRALADGLVDCVVSDHSPCHPRPEAAGLRRLRRGVGRHRLAPARAAARLDRRPGPGRAAGRRWSGGCRRRRPRWRASARKGAIETGARRRPGGLRAGRDVRGRPGAAAPPQPGHAVRRPHPDRRGPRGPAARARGSPPRERSTPSPRAAC